MQLIIRRRFTAVDSFEGLSLWRAFFHITLLGILMKSKLLLCVFSIVLIAGCSSSEPTSMSEGLEQSEIDKYNEMIAEDARQAAGVDMIEDK